MVLLCIDDDFSKAENILIRNLFLEGRTEFFPKKGLTYETKSTYYFKNGKTAYQFKEIPSAVDVIGIDLYFLSERFEDLNIFKPDYVDENGYSIRREILVVEPNIIFPQELNENKDTVEYVYVYNKPNNKTDE